MSAMGSTYSSQLSHVSSVSSSEGTGYLVGADEFDSVSTSGTTGAMGSDFHGSQLGSTSLVGKTESTSEGAESLGINSSHSVVLGSMSASHRPQLSDVRSVSSSE